MVHVGPELEAVVAFDDGKIVADLVPLLHAVHKRERLAPEKCYAGNVHGHVSAARRAGEVIKQSAPRILVAQFVDLAAAHDRRFLHADAPIVIVLRGGAGKSVLPKVLVLRVYLDTRYIAGAERAAQHQ